MNRNEIYLNALLDRIPNIESQGDFLEVDKYATANQGFKNPQTFVISPFENLKKPNNKSDKQRIASQELTLEKSIFPNEKAHNPKTIDELWTSFKEDYEEFSKDKKSDKAKAKIALSLLQKYAIAIPNPTAVHPEVSWYDYAKIKAGLAVCLYDLKGENTENPLLIIRGGVSGIQDFIFNIASKNASKNLKGRSFYVQLIVNTVLQLLLKKLDLFDGNVMYASGGNFFVIAPNTKKVKKDLEEFESQITAALFEEYKTRLSVVIADYPVSKEQILSGKIDKAIKQLFNQEVDRKKKQKFATLIEEDYDLFFKEDDKRNEEGGDNFTDAITGEEIIVKDNEQYYILDDDAFPSRVSGKEIKQKRTNDEIVEVLTNTTAKQIFIGSNLKDIKYWANTNAKTAVQKHKITEKTEVLPLRTYNEKLYHYLVSEKQLQKLELKKPVIQTINNFDLNHNHLGFTLYGGNQSPTFNIKKYTELIKNKKDEIESKIRTYGDFKDFNHLALKFLDKTDKDENQKVAGFKRLGILRMDIDGLGTIFRENAARPNLTFSYYAALSRNLDWFFKGYLNTLWETKSDFKHSTQIIYSGGDDLFIVGRWDSVTEFGKIIKEEFAAFTGADSLDKNQQVTISGGVSIVTEKFPIMKAADMAGDAEHAAKTHLGYDKKTGNSYKKDSFNFLKTSLNWETEFKMVERLKNEFVKHVGEKNNQIPKSFLGKIQMHAESAKQYRKAKEAYDKLDVEDQKKTNSPGPRWIWTIIYDFSRMADRLKRSKNYNMSDKVSDIQNKVNQSAKEFVQELSKNVFTNSWNGQDIKSQYHFLELLSVAARWAEIESRGNK